MNINKVIFTAVMASSLYGGNNVSKLIKDVNGYARLGYQQDNSSNKDLALGGKLHIETNSWYGLSFGTSLYASSAIGKHNGAGVPFFDDNNSSYAILAEAYLLANYSNTTIKIGRQEIDTPYADTDDIGMIPNTFEAIVLENRDFSDITFVAAYINKMSGVDATKIDKFANDGMDGGIALLGATYEGIKDLALQAWYYNVKDSAGDRALTYFDAIYSISSKDVAYEIGLQYATEDAFKQDEAGDSKIFGIYGSIGLKSAGINLTLAYNSTNGTAADNGFGGGPFFTSAEHLTLLEAGANGKVFLVSAQWDASTVGLDGLSLGVGYSKLKAKNKAKAKELDLTANYAFSDNLEVGITYSKINDNINSEKFKNTRVFVNYKF
jgi:hypothetical protein